jgi:predicted RNA-binding protein with RPS1 domain
LTVIDPGNQTDPIGAPQRPIENQSATTSLPANGDSQPVEGPSAESEAAATRRSILIGSQRDPVAYRARQKRDWTPVDEGAEKPKPAKKAELGRGAKPQRGLGGVPPSAPLVAPAVDTAKNNLDKPSIADLDSEDANRSPLSAPAKAPAAPRAPSAPVPIPKADEALDFDDELSQAMGGVSMDELFGGSKSDQETFEPDSLQSGRVVAVRRDDVFVEFNGCQQGIVSLRLFDVPPAPGAMVQVIVQRINPEDGLYELSLPNKAVQVDDWSDLVEGMLVDVRVTGHNAGGLECEINHIRGFIPISQVSLYRVEDLAPYVDQRFTCVITEANPERRNLVLSRRAVLEREKEQAREQMLSTLRPGQIHEGVVRKLMDFGAFVDIGGVDGLLHVSQVAWGRVKHPSDVLKEGQAIKVRVEKIDPETGKISLAYRDLLESPWTLATQKYPQNTVASGTVTKLMDFGAFVELEPGIEGLVHISELSPKRIWRASDVVKEGQQVEVMVLSVDPEAQRMSLSMKALAAPPEPTKKEKDEAEAAAASPSKKSNKPTGPLRGGLGKRTGERFGLNW